MNVDDPTPPHDYGDDATAVRQAERDAIDPDTPRERITLLADAGLLSERQAQVYVARALEGRHREDVADDLGIKPNSVDEHYRRARAKLRAARESIRLLSDYHCPPTSCAECGQGLARWTHDDDGRALCLDCAGISLDD